MLREMQTLLLLETLWRNVRYGLHQLRQAQDEQAWMAITDHP